MEKTSRYDKTFFIVCGVTSMYFLFTSLTLSHSNIDGFIIMCFGLFLMVLPFITPKSFLEKEAR